MQSRSRVPPFNRKKSFNQTLALEGEGQKDEIFQGIIVNRALQGNSSYSSVGIVLV